MISRFLGAMACTAVVALGSPGEGKAAVAEYWGSFSDMGWTGQFSGTDLNGDGKLTGDELAYASGIYWNGTWGLGQFYGEADRFDHFVFSFVSPTQAIIEVEHTFRYKDWHCGGWGQEPCSFYEVLYPGSPLYSEVSRSFPATIHNVSFSYSGVIPAPVPLPAGAPLMAAGIGALALIRRRKRRG